MAEDNLDMEEPSLVHAALGPWDGGVPVEEVVVGGGELDGAEVLLLEVGNLAVYTLERRLRGQ